MKYRIKWLGTELDEALLVKGRWWWRRCALVYRDLNAAGVATWKFVYSDYEIAHEIHVELENRRGYMHAYGHCELDWQRDRKRPSQRRLAQPKLKVLP